MDYKAIGRRIRRRRKEKGLTQDRLSEMIGRSLSFQGHIERGTRKASMETLKAICECLEISIDDIMGHSYESSVNELAKELLHIVLQMAETLSAGRRVMRDKIHMYIDSIALKKLTPRTQHHYGWVLDNLEKYLREKHFPGEESVDASKVTCGMLLDYAKALDQRGLEISTYNNYIIAIKMFFEWLARIRCIETDPSLVLSCARDKQKKADVSVKEPAYNEDELRLFLADIVRGRGKLTTHRDLAILSLILSSGMRAHEVSCLDIRHLDEIADGYAFSMQKGGAVGKILVNNDACYPVIAEYVGRRTDNPGPDDPLFISQQGVRICPNTLWQAFERRQERLGLRSGIHCFRSYFLTDADRSGGGGAARDLGRHKNIKITSRYIRHSQQDLGGVLQDMRLSGVLKELLSA